METINPQEWKQDLPAFKEKTDQFYAGELSKADYKGFSGGYGSYAQKDGKASMIRLRMSGGHLTKDKLKFIADSIKTYNVDKVLEINNIVTGRCWNCDYGWRWRFSTKCDVFSVVRCGSG